ncbi:hypothetical protein O2W18_12805 [Modestobacter sp. VKM Ac-2983]|nr:hypothetical protein [Modestobacter sp. VKM Ac-2983]MCZ2805990.1 hypothetical protein [Modestobacter sp. VKM Ac-2983]
MQTRWLTVAVAVEMASLVLLLANLATGAPQELIIGNWRSDTPSRPTDRR